MTEEYFDLIDENNEYTGETAPRSVAHTTGLWHRVIHVYFFRKTGMRFDFLVHLRSKDKDLSANKWDTRFGGHLEAGKSLEETVLEEIRDEVGLTLKIDDLIEGDFQKDDYFPNREFVKNYFYEFKANENDLKFKDGEVQEVRWVNEDEIIKSLEGEPEIWTTTNVQKFARLVALLKSKYE